MKLKLIIIATFIALVNCQEINVSANAPSLESIPAAALSSKDPEFLRFYRDLQTADSDDRIPIIVNLDGDLEDHLLMLRSGSDVKFPIDDDYRLYLFYKKVNEFKDRRTSTIRFSTDQINQLESRKSTVEQEIKKIDEEIKKQNSFTSLFSSKGNRKRDFEAELADVNSRLNRFRRDFNDATQRLEKLNRFFASNRVTEEIQRLGQIPAVKAKIEQAENTRASELRRRKKKSTTL